MWRAALKSLLGRKLRLLMSTFAIVLGVAFVAGSLIFSDTLSRSFTALFASTVGDVVVRPVGGTTGAGTLSSLTVPASLLDELEETPGVARVDGNVSAFGVYVVGEDGKVIGGLGPPALGVNYNDAPAAGGEGLELVEGKAPSGVDEVALDQATADKAGYEFGDTVELLTPRGDSKLSPTLVGLAGFPDGGSLNGATLAMFDTETSQALFLEGRDEYNDVWVTAEEGVSQDELRDAVTEVLPEGIEAVTGDEAADESASQLLEAVSFITTFLLIFAGIALVVGSFLIVNTFSILVAQRSRELALLRALGASTRQVVRSVQLEAFVLGVIGSTIGLGLGVLLAMALRVLFAQFGLDLSGQPMIFGARTVLASYLVGVLVTMAAAWLPARRTAKISPVQAMRDDIALTESSIHHRFWRGLALAVVGMVVLALGLGDIVEVPYGGWLIGAGVLFILLGVAAMSPVISRPFLAGARSLFARLFGSIGNLAGQNSLRNPRRTTATASALMIGLALACTMSIVGDSAKASVDQSVEESFVGDYVVSNVFGGEFNPTIADQMADVDGVEAVVRQRYQFQDFGGEGISAVDPATVDRLELTVVEGDLSDFTDGSVIVQESYADEEGLGVGDPVEVEVPTGKTEWRVAAVFEDNPLIYLPVVTTLTTLEKAGYEPADNALTIFAEPGADDLQAGLDAVVEELPIVTVKDQAAFAEEQREPIDQFVLIIFALLGLALIIAVLGIVNTLALSVIERTREVGLLRAIGVSRSQLRWMITLESVVISVLGAVLGVILGIGFGVVLMYAVRDEGLEVISVPYGQLAVFLALSVLIGMLAAVLPARRAARLDVLEAIATE
ncbi:MAG: FtsX-like permease family protein [Nocardioides sp.]|jgi:putative ABC transport system permease protein